MIKNITLNGTEIAVDKLNGYNAAIRNNGTETVYASAKPDISPGADGVLAVKSGESCVYPNCGELIFLKGVGNVTVIGIIGTENPFGSASGSGTGTSMDGQEFASDDEFKNALGIN